MSDEQNTPETPKATTLTLSDSEKKDIRDSLQMRARITRPRTKGRMSAYSPAEADADRLDQLAAKIHRTIGQHNEAAS
jgi:hypothetical protein